MFKTFIAILVELTVTIYEFLNFETPKFYLKDNFVNN